MNDNVRDFPTLENVLRRPPLREGGGGGDNTDMEARLKALETIIPTLATKSDMAELRADMHEMNAGISRWMLGTVITVIGTIVLGFAGLLFNLTRVVKPDNPPAQQMAPIVITVPAPTPPAPSASR